MAALCPLDLAWSQQIGGYTGTVRGAPVHLTVWRQPPVYCPASRPSIVGNPAFPTECVAAEGLSSDGRCLEQEQELLWRRFFLDPTMWWDYRLGKRSSRSPDFRHKESGEALWLNSTLKPAWVDEQLVLWDMKMAHGPSPSNVSTLCQQGKLTEAFSALESQAQTDCPVSRSLLYTVLKVCAAKKDLDVGRRVHDLCVKLGHESDTFLVNHIVRMYACGGRLQEAMDVFTRVAKPDAFMWSSIITAHAKQGKPKEAIELYNEVRSSGMKADAHVFVAALQACALAADLDSGRTVHCDVVNSGISPDLFVGNSLVDMYAKCGKLDDARRVFDSLAKKDVVTWNALIAGYAQQGLGQKALLLYERMDQEGLIVADQVTFACILKACASTGAIQKGRQVHLQIVERCMVGNILLSNCLVDMYAKCGELSDARGVFDSMAKKDMVTWNALIAGYAQQGLGQEALDLYGQMEREGFFMADQITFACLLKACASTGALQMGRHLHSQIVERGLPNNILVGTCLVDMYAKCGELEEACRVFDSLATKDVVAWNALISGCGACDEGEKALACFEDMLAAGIQPDDATFTCLLVSCSHEGLVEEGRKLFNSMFEQYGIKPTIDHDSSMVDLLGRAGHLNEAEKILLTSCKGDSNVVGLRALLNACKIHGDIDRAARCFESLVRLEPQQASGYVLMANTYADAGMWTDVYRIETQRKAAGAKKKPAVARIEVKNQVHTFVVGENRNDLSPIARSINALLKQEGGHVPHTKLVLKPVPQKEKEDMLCGHAEKLALAYGLLNTPSGTPLLVTKNLRMCSDCHSSTEIMSRIENRDIVVRDGYRVHRFAAGCCSCKGRP